VVESWKCQISLFAGWEALMANLDDIFATQKNGVVAINNLASYIQNISTKYVGITLSDTSLTTTIATLYTAPAGSRSYITEIDISNTNATPTSVYFHIVAPTSTGPGTASASDALLYAVQIPGNSIFQWTGALLFTSGYTLQAKASAAGCNIFVTGGTVA
jgi:hypothetical protein